MDFFHTDYGNGLIGGALIGLSASLLLLARGRIAGISGMLASIIFTREGQTRYQITFFLGLIIGGWLVGSPESFENLSGRPIWLVAIAGLLVGYGTQLGSGCTSGHGVCGNSRLSPRSIAATVTFILSGAMVVLILRSLPW